MADFITCPRCQRRLKMPAKMEVGWFTCPACLAKIQNPATQITSGPVSSTAPPFSRSTPSIGRRFLDREVHRDMGGTASAFVILSLLGCLGYGFVAWNILRGESGLPWEAGALTVIFGGLALAAIISVCMGVLSKYFGVISGPLRFLGVFAVGALGLTAAFIVFFLACNAAVWPPQAK